MSHWLRIVAVLVIAWPLLAVQVIAAKELEDRNWIEVQTPNFRIRSALGERDSIELVRYLELFRAAADALTNVSSVDASVPIEIFVLGGRRDLKRLGIDSDAAGMFRPGLRVNTIIVRDTSFVSENSIIVHEYAHFLMRNHSGFIYPKWFDEGFAEYFTSVRTHAGNFEVGRPPERHRTTLVYGNWIPMQEVLSPEDYAQWPGDRRAMFYSQSWALVHYLVNRPEGRTFLGEGMARYIGLVESGRHAVEAFEEAFMITADELDNRIKGYLRRGRFAYFRLKVDELLPDFSPRVITPSREQISLALAQLARRTRQFDKAERWFTIAAADPSARPHAEAGLGRVLLARGEFEAARFRFEQAVALAPEDAYCQLDLAGYWHARAEVAADDAIRADQLQRAREHYVKAWRLDDTIPETYAMYGQTLLMEGQQIDKAIEMLEAGAGLLPSNIELRAMLAKAYMAGGRKEDAESRAKSVLAWSHGESDAAARAREVLASLETGGE